jgi:glycosidase
VAAQREDGNTPWWRGAVIYQIAVPLCGGTAWTYDEASGQYYVDSFLDCRDERPIASRYGQAQARVAMLVLLTLRGTPSIWVGDELGVTDRDVPDDRRRDPRGEHRPDLSRDTVRPPMAWSATGDGGFSDAVADDWFLPRAPWAAERSVERARHDDTSMLALVRRMERVRRAHPAPRHSGSTILTEVHDVVSALTGDRGDEAVVPTLVPDSSG